MYLALLAAAIVIGCVLRLLDAGVAGFGSARDVGETIGMVAAAFLVAAVVPTMAVLLFHKRMGSAAAPPAIGIAVLLVFSHLSYRGMEVQRASTSFPFKAPGCTFSASFPEPPEVRELFLAGGLVVTQANLYSDTLLRAECLPTGGRLAPTEEAVLAELGQHAHRNGLMDVEFEVSDMDGFVSGVGNGQVWGMRSGSGLVLGRGDRLAVAEADTANDLSEAVGAVQSAPVALG